MDDLTASANKWLEINHDEATRAELKALLDAKDEAELRRRFASRIAFGTAGLRARMGAGPALMNCVTVIQASQGLAEYVKAQSPDKTPAVVVGRDARHNSQKFAELAAAAFVARGLRVHYFDDIVATPLVPFAVAQLGAAAGVVVTASHNPAADNGYKVYWANGSQIIPPHDAGIAAAIEANLKPEVWQLDRGHSQFALVGEDVPAAYYARIAQVAQLCDTSHVPAFVYTPMHGVGLPFLTAALGHVLKAADADSAVTVDSLMTIVTTQARPDPDFSTVAFPNPEERGALDLAMAAAEAKGVSLVVANDPDADRLAVAQRVEGAWHIFSGNELGVLLASYVLEVLHPDTGSLALLTTAVSSSMLAHMARVEGATFVETLTGFKWLGNVAQDLISQGRAAPYAFEEALGYMFTGVVCDKDGIAAACVFLAACSHWTRAGHSPHAQLQRLYAKYGFFADANTYLVSPSPGVTRAAFEAIRQRGADGTAPHPARIGGRQILSWRDLTTGYDSATRDTKPLLPVDPASQMITCELAGGVRFTVRGSGTEPKIKLYVDSRGETAEQARAAAEDARELVIREWFPLERYGLRRG